MQNDTDTYSCSMKYELFVTAEASGVPILDGVSDFSKNNKLSELQIDRIFKKHKKEASNFEYALNWLYSLRRGK